MKSKPTRSNLLSFDNDEHYMLTSPTFGEERLRGRRIQANIAKSPHSISD
jgi:hypothetical protein